MSPSVEVRLGASKSRLDIESRVLHHDFGFLEPSENPLGSTLCEGGTMEPTRPSGPVKIEGMSTFEKWRHLHKLQIQHSRTQDP